ncbi:MAG: DUF4253 domain-containing protein [Flavobacterium sp.]|uniref:DUF4253 domain-containing protein n=1 Tax=Flavobacterium sp. TaxID=239 RepID=UPI001219F2B8|nr:DUF4253 domain-containing protein [Flavobacterium sp.]RZJ66108.1 MAG: DUF4253 domain-containing protein [Flavobacterium sp.]
MKIRIPVLLLSGLFFVGVSHAQLTKTESELVAKLNFDAELASLLKKEAGSALTQLPTIDAETGEIASGTFDGIVAINKSSDNEPTVENLRAQFKQKGYLLFEFSDGADLTGIAILKGGDDLDIVKYRNTQGPNHDVDNNMIVASLEKWKKLCNFTVVGCADDWVKITFETLPKNMTAFAKDVYKLCPDSVDQGAGTLTALKDEITDTKSLMLWWD